MKILYLVLGSAGRPGTQTFLVSDGEWYKYFKRVIRENIDRRTVWLCGGEEGQEPFIEASHELSKELEKAYQSWLSPTAALHCPPKKSISHNTIEKVSLLFLGVVVSLTSATFSILDSRNFSTWMKLSLSALTGFGVGYTVSSYSKSNKNKQND